MSQFSAGMTALADSLFQAAEPKHYTLAQIERAIADYNLSNPAQKWSFKRHRNGAMVKCGREKINLSDSGVFIHPLSWSVGWDDKLGGHSIEIHYSSSVEWPMPVLLKNIGLLDSVHRVDDLIYVYIPNMMPYARYFLRSETEQVLQEMKDELAGEFWAQIYMG